MLTFLGTSTGLSKKDILRPLQPIQNAANRVEIKLRELITTLVIYFIKKQYLVPFNAL